MNFIAQIFLGPKVRRLRCLAIAPVLLWSAFAFAQNGATNLSATGSSSPTSSLLTRHPAGSIQSIESADRALGEAVQLRAIIEDRFARDQRECYPKFFTTSCLDDAKERRRIALGQVRAIEVEANTYKRRARVLERDKALAERRAQEESEAPQRMKAQLEAETRAANKASANAREMKSGDATPGQNEAADKQAGGREIKRKREKTAEQINANKRAENIAAYDKKVQDAAAHQRAIAARKAEKERDKERQTTGKESPALPAVGSPAAGSPAAGK